MEQWRTLGEEYLYERPWCSFRVDEVRLPDGAQIEYGVLESAGFVAVVPVTEGGDVVLAKQWRQPLGSFTFGVLRRYADGQPQVVPDPAPAHDGLVRPARFEHG